MAAFLMVQLWLDAPRERWSFRARVTDPAALARAVGRRSPTPTRFPC